jgi:hypothetical protein
MKRWVVFGFACAMSLVVAFSSLAADQAKVDKKPQAGKQGPPQQSVTGVIEKVLAKQQQIVVNPQAGAPIQQQTDQKQWTDKLTIRVDRKTKILGAAVDKSKFGKGQPAQETPAQEKPAQEKPAQEKPAQEEKKQEEPKPDQQDKKQQTPDQPHPISQLCEGQLVRVVYVEITVKADADKKDEGKKDEGKKDEGKKDEGKKDEGTQQAPPEVQDLPKQEDGKDKPKQDQDKPKQDEPEKGKGKGVPPSEQVDKKDQPKKTVLRAISVQILKAAADKEQKTE